MHRFHAHSPFKRTRLLVAALALTGLASSAADTTDRADDRRPASSRPAPSHSPLLPSAAPTITCIQDGDRVLTRQPVACPLVHNLGGMICSITATFTSKFRLVKGGFLECVTTRLVLKMVCFDAETGETVCEDINVANIRCGTTHPDVVYKLECKVKEGKLFTILVDVDAGDTPIEEVTSCDELVIRTQFFQ